MEGPNEEEFMSDGRGRTPAGENGDARWHYPHPRESVLHIEIEDGVDDNRVKVVITQGMRIGFQN